MFSQLGACEGGFLFLGERDWLSGVKKKEALPQIGEENVLEDGCK